MNTRKRKTETEKITFNTGEIKTEMSVKKIKDEDSSLFLDDIIMEIIKRLNAKTLLRFRSVSKLWNYIITHPYFVNLHHNFSSPMILCSFIYMPLYHDRSLLYSTEAHRRPSEHRKSDQLYFFTISKVGKVSNYLSIKASDIGFKRIDEISDVVNGLVCINCYNSVAVCNISTREIVYLPKTRKKSYTNTHLNQNLGTKRTNFVPIYSLGFDPLTGEYKVLRIWVNLETDFMRCEMFTLGKSKYWREIDDKPTEIDFVTERSNYISGSLYWLCRDNKQLVKFDFQKEKFRTIGTPKSISYSTQSVSYYKIQVEGCFGIRTMDCVYILDEEKELWVRKDLEIGDIKYVGSSKTKLFFLQEQEEDLGKSSQNIASSLNLICFDHKGQRTLTNIAAGSFPFRPTLLTRMGWPTIAEHCENMYPLIRT